MKRSLSLQQLVLALVAGTMLFAQVLGLHHHLHSGNHGHPVEHGVELHFGDAGMHDEDHEPADTGHAAGHHAASDVEMPGVGDGLAKTFFKLLPLTLLLVVSLLLPTPVRLRLSPTRRTEPSARPHPFSLRPPSNGPPGLRFQSV